MTATDGGSPTTNGGTGGRPLGSAYVVHELIGRGATGEVWRGADRRTGAPVAVKLLRSEFADDPHVVERFLRERSALSELDAPNIVGLRDLVVEGDTVALVTDLVPGGDLRARLRREGTLAPALAVDLTCQVLEGLDAAHQHGVIHRDLKPENLLVEDGDDGPRVRITDFGIARLAYSSGSTVTTSIIGSPEYLAPEVIELGAVTPAVDLYSAGIVLYELLAGRTPFAGGPPIAVVRRQVDEAPPRIPGLPLALWAEVATLLAKDPAARPRRARTAAKRLAELADELDALPALIPGVEEPDVVDLVAVEAAEDRNGNGGHERVDRSEHETTRVRARNVVDEVVHRAPAAPGPAKRRAWQRVAPFVAAGVVLVGMGAVWVARRADAAHGSSLHYTAAPVVELSGAVVTRTLALSGANGDHLAVRLRIDNPTAKPIATVDEPGLVGQAQTAPLRQYHLALAPGDTTTKSYTTKLDAGPVDVPRLVAIEAQLDLSSIANALTAAHATPNVLTLRPRERAYINLSGLVLHPSDADRQHLLSAIAWHSSDAHVADMTDADGSEWRPIVVASHKGRAVLHADVGTQALDVEVIVSGKPVDATDSPCEPGVGDPPGLTTIPDNGAIATPGNAHVFVIAGGARVPVTTAAEYGAPPFPTSPQQLDDVDVDAITMLPRDGTVFQVGGLYRVVVAGALVAVDKPRLDALQLANPTPVRVPQDWLGGLAAYPGKPLTPRDGTLVSDFARTKTELWHDGTWSVTPRACPSANVARLPQAVSLPTLSAQ